MTFRTNTAEGPHGVGRKVSYICLQRVPYSASQLASQRKEGGVAGVRARAVSMRWSAQLRGGKPDDSADLLWDTLRGGGDCAAVLRHDVARAAYLQGIRESHSGTSTQVHSRPRTPISSDIPAPSSMTTTNNSTLPCGLVKHPPVRRDIATPLQSSGRHRVRPTGRGSERRRLPA